MADTTAIIAAAGRSTRFSESTTTESKQSKVFLKLHGKPLWQYSVDVFRSIQRVGPIYLVIASDAMNSFAAEFDGYLFHNKIRLVAGGAERWASIQSALTELTKDLDAGLVENTKLVAIHDAARPCIKVSAIQRVIDFADRTGASILGVPIWGTLKRVDAKFQVMDTPSRQNLYQATTPQVFRRDWLAEVYKTEFLQTLQSQQTITDDAQLISAAGHAVTICEDSPSNIKVTTQADWDIVSKILS